MNSSKLRGFTLIELVVVITILGILAAFAVPRFIALDSQARIATVNGLAGAAKSAAALARSLAMATGNPASVAMEGAAAPVTLTSNYPDGTATGIGAAVNTNAADFTFTPGASATAAANWAKVGAPGVCTVVYAPPTVAGTAPAVTVNTAGC
jgi:MSHA pilin protein MshA